MKNPSSALPRSAVVEDDGIYTENKLCYIRISFSINLPYPVFVCQIISTQLWPGGIQPMRMCVTVSDGTFPSLTAPLQGPIEETARRAAEIGFDSLQLTVNRPSELNVRAVRRAVGAHGLKIASLATGRGYTADGLSLGSGDEENRRGAVRRMKEHVELSAELENPLVVVGAIRGRSADSPTKEIYIEQFTRSFHELLPYAEQHGVTVVLEANDHLETDMYLDPVETADTIRRFHSPSFRLHLDTMHLWNEGIKTCDWLAEQRDILAQVDISDAGRTAPDGMHYDFPAFLRSLCEIGYDGPLVFEYRPAPPENAARVGFDYISQCLLKSNG
jgi:D-psicose/D-tagatose/L-ribulose 3-epimerase